MPTEIRQVEDEITRSTTLHVSGEMSLSDAVFVEDLAEQIRETTGNEVIVDLADLDLLDSEAAPVLRKFADRSGFRLDGMEIFLQNAVDDAERRHD